ncbi:hypothetical protein NUW58_g1380 [Xylaria curta]|uniref:Uncharacterized protein n=1 Tax=Xylaria curta TaxID=42375 RepID=A0ACC1PMJ5_9PEZI|nr:hypothetical protein NUW58_g1380 [Xylaria curta]
MLGRILVATLVAFASVALAADLSGVNLGDVPQCGLLCIANTVAAKSSCSPTDFPCVCADTALTQELERCFATECSPRDALTTAKIAKDLCGAPARNIQLAVWLVPLINIILSTTFFILKLLSRVVLRQRFDIGDVALGISVGLTFPVLWVAFELVGYGLGQDVWNIPQDNITNILYLYWWAEIFYQAGLPLTRISILCFYLKVFPQRYIRWASIAFIVLNASDLIAFVVATVFQCYPIYGAWTFWDGSFEGHCNDIHLQGWVQAGINIALDILVITLPLPPLSRLTVSRQKKAQIMFMFSLGFFITIISIIRLKTLVVFANSINVSFDYVEPGLYSITEASVSIIIGCLPAVRALLRRVMPDLFASTRNLSVFSNGKPPKDEVSRQKFDRLEGTDTPP